MTIVAGGCNEGAARESLAFAEQALEEARPELEPWVAEEVRVLESLLADARRDLDAGRYTDALRTAQGFPARLRIARERAERLRRQLGHPPEPGPDTHASFPETE